jgi:transposase
MEKMSQQQWKRMDVLKRLEHGALTVGEAAQVLGLSHRQVQRIRWAVVDNGVKGVVHGNTGRAPAHRINDEVRERVIGLWRSKYVKFNDQHFTEKLQSKEGLDLSARTVRRILRAAGIGPTRKRRPRKHRRRRDRKAQAGMMILWDGSRHDWLEGRGPLLCLMGAIDDATGEFLAGAHFVEQECAAGYLQVLLAIAQEKGLPLSAYMDQHGSLKRNDSYWTLEEELRGEQQPTHVGQALKALEVEVIFALSPQAKGRVERLWGTLQDRLSSELRLAKTSTLEEANRVLEAFRSEFNARFTVPAAEAECAWRPVRKGLDLLRTCSFYYEATVQNDNTVHVGGTLIDIPPGPQHRSYAKARVEVRQLLDGSWRVYHQDLLIATAPSTKTGELRAKPKRKRSAASRAFRKAVLEIQPPVPKRRRGRAQPYPCGQAKSRLPTGLPRRLTPPMPFNFFPRKQKRKKPQINPQGVTKSLAG